MKTPVVFALLATLCALPACTDPGPADELSDAKRRWEAWGPASYDLTVSRSCECTPQMGGPVIVVVRGGAIQSRTYSVTGQAVDDLYAPGFPDVDGLFAFIAQAIRDGHLGGVNYDEVTGYPRTIRLDLDGPATNGVDGEIDITVTMKIASPGS